MVFSPDSFNDATYGLTDATLLPGNYLDGASASYGLEATSPSLLAATTNSTLAGPDLVTVSVEAFSDHVLEGQTTLTFVLENQGSQAASQFDVSVVYSDDEIIGNADDLTVRTLSIGGLSAGGSVMRSLNLQLPIDVLNRNALAEDAPNLGAGYQSQNRDFLGIVVDAGNDVVESNETNNQNQGKGIDTEDVTYFPWDIDGNGQVTPTDAIFAINRLGQNANGINAKADFDGNGVITPTDAIAAINRLGYAINTSVFEPTGPTEPEVPNPEPGDTTARAFNVGKLGAERIFADSVSDTDRFDYYRFELDSISNFSIDLDVLNERFDANVKIVDVNGAAVFNPAETNGFDESGTTLLEEGVYYALVQENGFNSSTNYLLSLAATPIEGNFPPSDPGETTARAFDLGVLSEPQTLNAFVSDADASDYYRFELDSVSNFIIDFDVLNEWFDANVKIVDVTGAAVFNPSETNGFDEFGETLLEEGVYYALIEENGFDSGTEYVLRLGATAITNNLPPSDPGETPARAFDLGTLGSTQTLNAFISDADASDYYRFELDGISNFTIDFDVLNERFDANVKIVDATGAAVFNPSEINGFDEFGETLLEEGVYYALVEQNGFNSGTAYTLRLGATPVRNNRPSVDPGETIARAFDLGKLGNTQTLNAFISDADASDYYRFELDGISNFTIDFDVLNERFDANVKIVDATGAAVFNPAESNGFDEFGETLLEEGVYYALVEQNGFDSGTAYTLRLGATAVGNNQPPRDPGESLSTAYNLGLLSSTQNLNAFISDADPFDYYRFRVGNNSLVNVDLDVLNQRFDANVRILDSLGATIYSPPEVNGFDEFGNVQLQAGSYFAVVVENGFNSGTEYLLKLGIVGL